MALTTTVVGFCFVFENEDFLFFALSQYFCSYFSAFNNGSTYFNITVVNDCQYLVEYYVGINIGIQFFDENAVAFQHGTLLCIFDDTVACSRSLIQYPAG